MSYFVDIYNLITSNLAPIATFSVALAALINSHYGHLSNRANAILNLYSKYSEEDIYAAVRRLWALEDEARKQGKSPGELFLEKHKTASSESMQTPPDDVEVARRKVKFYFFKIFQMKKVGLLKSKNIKSFVTKEHMKLMLNVLLDIEYKYNISKKRDLPDVDKKAYLFFDKLETNRWFQERNFSKLLQERGISSEAGLIIPEKED